MKARRRTREELLELVTTATALRMTHVHIQIPVRARPGARMRLNGRTSPWSDHQREITKVRTGLWAAWWRVEEISAWLGLPARSPMTAPPG